VHDLDRRLAVQQRLDARAVADEHDLAEHVAVREQRAGDDRARRVVAAHRVHRDDGKLSIQTGTANVQR
jgi:hypothetical protein